MVKKIIDNKDQTVSIESATLLDAGEVAASPETTDGVIVISEPTIDAEPVSIGNPDDVLEPIVKNYEGFDPNAHAVNADGTPRMKSGGGFAAKRGRKPGQTSQGKSAATKSATLPVSPQNEVTAKLCANILINGGVQLFGPHWAPIDKQEGDSLKGAFKDYFDSIGGVDLPPGIALVIAVGMYTLPRVMHEETQKKIDKWALSFKKSAPQNA
jgi:hypothetical protein